MTTIARYDPGFRHVERRLHRRPVRRRWRCIASRDEHDRPRPCRAAGADDRRAARRPRGRATSWSASGRAASPASASRIAAAHGLAIGWGAGCPAFVAGAARRRRGARGRSRRRGDRRTWRAVRPAIRRRDGNAASASCATCRPPRPRACHCAAGARLGRAPAGRGARLGRSARSLALGRRCAAPARRACAACRRGRSTPARPTPASARPRDGDPGAEPASPASSPARRTTSTR